MSAVATAILLIAAVAVTGLVLGSIRIRGIGLGSAGVLFAGIIAGHFGAVIEPEIAHFAKEFGLVLFVFAIGLHLGPGIFQLWREQGLVLNAMAVSIVGQGFLLVAAAAYLLDFSVTSAAGLFSGATTNTPSLGAAQQAAISLLDAPPEELGRLASTYAVAYPGGIVGIIAVMLVLRRVWKIDVKAEAAEIDSRDGNGHEKLIHRSVVIENQRLSGTKFGELPGLEETGVRISRLRRADEDQVHVASDASEIFAGDTILVVGTENGLGRFTPLIGRVVEEDLFTAAGNVTVRRIVVTEPKMLNQPLRRLSLDQVYNTTVTRIRRSGIEMPARGSSRFVYGDVATVVGEEEALDRVASALGNAVKRLDETQFAPLFLGIAVGVLIGAVPLSLPGVPFPVRLGLAGGPLIAAIAFSLIGRVGGLVWYIPFSANLAMRELGIILFLASAGLTAGQTFFEVALTARGAVWMAVGFAVTTIPLLTTALAARLLLGMNYLTICGVVAGSMTDPPALAFANSLSPSPASSTAYAAVYPLTMIMRIIAAQAIIYLLAT